MTLPNNFNDEFCVYTLLIRCFFAIFLLIYFTHSFARSESFILFRRGEEVKTFLFNEYEKINLHNSHFVTIACVIVTRTVIAQQKKVLENFLYSSVLE